MTVPFNCIELTAVGWYFKKLITISLHFSSLSFMLRSEAYVLISAAMRGKNDVSSTLIFYFFLLFYIISFLVGSPHGVRLY